ncbi:MAG: hypothetical protein GY845_23945 [Planctomycetes bacterium]|nr:hypothetical protein [Planctomycetota bacterium]
MSFERWGSLSVADHIDTDALVANVLLYDRLVFPVFTEAEDRDEREYWEKKGWDPDLQYHRLEQLGKLAIHKPWNADRRKAYVDRLKELKRLQDAVDPFKVTQDLIAGEDIKLPKGVTHVDIIAAYNSCKGIKSDFEITNKEDNLALQSYLLGRKLAVPKLNNIEDSLGAAIDLSNDSEFKKKREEFFDWQDYVVTKGYTPKEAVQYIEQLSFEYNDIVKDAVKKVYYRFAFTLGGVALGLVGAGLGNPIAGVSALLALVQFATFDRKPVIEAGETRAAAMFHDIKEMPGLEFKK